MYTRELRNNYWLLIALKKTYEEHGASKAEVDEHTKKVKKRIRYLLKCCNADREWEYSDRDWTGRHKWEVVDHVMSKEEEEEYKEYEWLHFYDPYGDGRDCTGAWFTHYISFFRIPQDNKTIIYHSQGCDL